MRRLKGQRFQQVTASVHCNDAVDWLQETGAIMFAVEHRYYGCHNMSACPVTSFSSPDDLRFLSSAQALEDLAFFIGHATAAFNLSGSSWVAWGGRLRPSSSALQCNARVPLFMPVAVTQECSPVGCV
jgi:hypothetical protein